MLASDQTEENKSAGTSDGHAAGVAGWLNLAAAPIFAIMALLTTIGQADMICSAMADVFPFDDMTTMYLLMSAFHLPAWLRFISARAR
jgi:hypothetical protein